MMTGGLNLLNIGAKEEALQQQAATTRAVQLQQMMNQQRASLVNQYKSALPAAFRDNGFVPKQYQQLLSKMMQPNAVGPFPDLDRLIAQSKHVEGAFFEPQQGVIDAYQSRHGQNAAIGAKNMVRPSSPSFAAPRNLAIAEGRSGSMHNVFNELLGRNMEYLGLQRQLNEGLQSQILNGLGAAAGHRAQIQAGLGSMLGSLGNTAANALAQTYNSPFTHHNWLSGTGGPAPGGHVSSYYEKANMYTPEFTSNNFNKFKKEPPKEEEEKTSAAGGNPPPAQNRNAAPPAPNKSATLQNSGYRNAGSNLRSQWGQ